VRGREVVLYWRGLDAGQKVEVPLDLTARAQGQLSRSRKPGIAGWILAALLPANR